VINIEKKFRLFLKKMPNYLLNILLGVSGFFVLYVIFGVEILKKIEIFNISSFANTLDNLFSKYLFIFNYTLVKVFVCKFFVIVLFLRIFKFLLRPKAIVVCHNTFSNTLSSYDKSIVNDCAVKKIDINLVEQMEQGNIVEAISRQDNIIKKVLKECDEFTDLIYYGIAHISLIFRAGFQIGDEGSVRLLHKKRNNQSVFQEISSEPDRYHVQLDPFLESYGNSSNEMLVIVATSQQVTDSDIFIFYNRGIRCKLRFYMREPSRYDFDEIDSYNLMDRLRTNILSEIRQVVKSENIERIHLVLATSSAFTFFLARSFSKHHDPEVVVYQYEHSTNEKYPWGISNTRSPETAVINQRLQ